MSAARRNQQLANDLARRAIAAAERRRAEAEGAEGDAEALAERLRQAAADDGTLTVDEAISAVTGEQDTASFNDLIRQPSEREIAKQRANHERLFGPEPEPEPRPRRPQGDADGGKGEANDAEYEDVWTEEGPQRMRVYDLNNLDHKTEDNQ